MSLPNWWSKTFTRLEIYAKQLNRIAETHNTASDINAGTMASRALAERIFTDPESERKYRKIQLKGIRIPTPSQRSIHPRSAEITEASVNVLYECWDDGSTETVFGDESLDRIRCAELQVKIVGNVKYGDRVISVEDHWRVDTHHYSEVPVEPHPWIHYQRGGHAQDVFAAGVGFLPGTSLCECLFDLDNTDPEFRLSALMQTPAPRIPLPPFDPVSAIDFVIAQHDGTIWTKLWSIAEYSGVMKESRELYWTPWFAALANPVTLRKLIPFTTGKPTKSQ